MRSQRGQVVPLIAVFVVFVGLTMVGVAHLAGGAVDRASAKKAADMAALAGAAEGEDAAGRFARANAAAVRSYAESDDTATVEVNYGGAVATSKAKREGRRGSFRAGDPAPALRAALARAEQILGHRLAVVRKAGYVVTLTAQAYQELLPRAAEAGLCPSGPNQLKVCGAT